MVGCDFTNCGTMDLRRARLIRWAKRDKGREKARITTIGVATRSAQRSGLRTAILFGSTSQPTRIRSRRPGTVHGIGQRPVMVIHKAINSMAALAKVFPSTVVVNRSWGCLLYTSDAADE